MDQSNFNFTNAKRAYEVKFYALPQILLQGEKYKDLSDSAILLYSVLRDRLSYSLSNNWVDENNNVYFIYTNNELKDLRNWSNNKINKWLINFFLRYPDISKSYDWWWMIEYLL